MRRRGGTISDLLNVIFSKVFKFLYYSIEYLDAIDDVISICERHLVPNFWQCILNIRQCALSRMHAVEKRKLLKTVSPQKHYTSTVVQTTPKNHSTNTTQNSSYRKERSSQIAKGTSQSTSFFINKENHRQLQ